MACSTRNKSEPEKKHFFQPLLPGFLSNFSIPKNFRQHLGEKGEEGNGMRHAILRDINSTGLWDVKIDMDEMTLKDGWMKFCIDHDLQEGDFLVFRHNGRLFFDVYILDRISNCQRDSPVAANILAKGKASSSSTARSYGYGTNARNNAEGLRKNGDQVHQGRISEYTPEGYPYFRAVVTQTAINTGAIWIPQKFARQHGLVDRWCDVEIIDEKGQSCPMALRHNHPRDGGGQYLYKRPPFYKANGLAIGDPVIFELIDSGVKPVMKFYRLVDKLEEEDRSEETEDSIDADSRFCHLVVKSYWLKTGSLYFPLAFARENGLRKDKYIIVLKDEKGRSWSLPLRLKNGGGNIGRWVSIHDANKLKIDDDVTLEFIKGGGNPVMKLHTRHIIRG